MELWERSQWLAKFVTLHGLDERAAKVLEEFIDECVADAYARGQQNILELT